MKRFDPADPPDCLMASADPSEQQALRDMANAVRDRRPTIDLSRCGVGGAATPNKNAGARHRDLAARVRRLFHPSQSKEA